MGSRGGFRVGAKVYCPRGLGIGTILEIGVRLDIREPPDPTLCMVRLDRETDDLIRYIHTWELNLVETFTYPEGHEPSL